MRNLLAMLLLALALGAGVLGTAPAWADPGKDSPTDGDNGGGNDPGQSGKHP